MKTLEEQLWDYIDGSASPEEKKNIEGRLSYDQEAQALLASLQEMNSHLSAIELDEPSMAFTRSVMDKVALEIPPVALKTHINKWIIYFLGGFFMLSLLTIFVLAVVNSNSAMNVKFPAMDYSFDPGKYLNSFSLKIFLFIDLTLALIYFDGVLRRKINAQKKGAVV